MNIFAKFQLYPPYTCSFWGDDFFGFVANLAFLVAMTTIKWKGFDKKKYMFSRGSLNKHL